MIEDYLRGFMLNTLVFKLTDYEGFEWVLYNRTLGKDPTVTQVALVASTIDSFHGLLASVRGVEDADSLEL